MKKIFIISILALSVVALSGCRKTTNTAANMPEYMSGNYSKQQHYLSIRGKGLTQMPDICADITTGNLLDDIRFIDLGDNQITSISADYSCLGNLQELNLSYNKLSSIKNLDKLKFLSKLELHKNEITSADGLEKLSTLKTLNLGYNQISDISALKNLKNLTTLELQQNQISDISPLSALTNLETLKLEYNQISDESQLKIFEYLNNLKWISLGMNQLPQDKVKALQDKINPAQQ
ncbi:MAG: leucine-rich repeat domain-containing protein [Candidatus Absconditicoccaceae bacterium]